jgi:GT2 family glycosyltransferase
VAGQVLYNRWMQPQAPLISVIIPNHNGAVCLKTCLQSLSRQSFAQFELLVVDNASRDSSIEVVRSHAPDAKILIQRENLGFAAAVNQGIKAAQGAWIAVLNNDTEADPEWLAECAAAIRRHPDASYFACCILDFTHRETIYSAGDCFLRAGLGYRRGQGMTYGPEYDAEIPIFSTCGCAALYRKETFEAHQGYEERFFAYLEDVDLGLRLQASGARGYYAPKARIYHLGGATSGGEFAPLAVRLRTRNSLLLLLKSLPAQILWRSLPMIIAAQMVWLGRALSRGRIFSCLRGWAGFLRHAPAMMRRRRSLRPQWDNARERLWRSILDSEDLARRDYAHSGRGTSRFLAWYFRRF